MYDQTLPFYLGRTHTLVEFADEMAFGAATEPTKWLPTLASFEQRWWTDLDAFAVMRPETYLELARRGLPMRVVVQDDLRIIVRKA
jgi:hypothetical protein